MKAKNTKKTVAKKPYDGGNKEFQQDFEKAYATILNNLTNEWIRNSDSSNDYYATAVRHVKEFGSVKIIYQPTQGEDGVEKADILLFTPKINRFDKAEMRKIMAKYDAILVEDYRNMKKDCDGKWFTEYEKEDANTILQIKKPFAEYKPNMWKMSWRVWDDIHGKGNFGWIPKQIQQFLDCFNESWYEEICEGIKEDYKKNDGFNFVY